MLLEQFLVPMGMTQRALAERFSNGFADSD
jgi:hypothetical protein